MERTPTKTAGQSLIQAYLEIIKPEVADRIIPLRFNPTEYQLQKQNTFAEIGIPQLPFIGAYAVRVHSLATTEALLRQEGMAMRRLGAALVVPFPDELGAGAWLFVENAADLPWRS